MGLTTACHPSIDGLPPRIHVDIDEVLAEIVEDDCSFDDAGDVVPRPGAVPKSTAGSLKLFVVVPMHGKGGEEIGEQAESMESGASYAIAQKIGPSYGLHICPKIGVGVLHGGGGPSCQRNKSEAAEPENLGRGRGETVGGHGT